MSNVVPVDTLISALGCIGLLDQQAVELLRALPLRLRRYDAGEHIVRAGSNPNESCFVVAGFAARGQYLADGGRQLDQIHISGDFVDLHSLHLHRIDHDIIALGTCEVAHVSHEHLGSAMAQSGRLTWILWQSTVLDGAAARTWVTCLGRRRADAALAHLVCELLIRLERRGLTKKESFRFPGTQGDLADMLGLSVVHINRTLAELRRLRLLEWSHNEVRVLDWERLAEFADFDDSYLGAGRPMPRWFTKPAHHHPATIRRFTNGREGVATD